MLVTFVHLGGLYQMKVMQPFLYQCLDPMTCQQLLGLLSIPANMIKANRGHTQTSGISPLPSK